MIKVCKDCKQELDVSKFTRWSSKRGIHCRPECNKCHYQRYKHNTIKYRQEKSQFLNELKSSQGCARCGYNEHPVALDFHHVDGRQGEHKGMYQLTMKQIQAEIELCIILCSNCHRIEHSGS